MLNFILELFISSVRSINNSLLSSSYPKYGVSIVLIGKYTEQLFVGYPLILQLASIVC